MKYEVVESDGYSREEMDACIKIIQLLPLSLRQQILQVMTMEALIVTSKSEEDGSTSEKACFLDPNQFVRKSREFIEKQQEGFITDGRAIYCVNPMIGIFSVYSVDTWALYDQEPILTTVLSVAKAIGYAPRIEADLRMNS